MRESHSNFEAACAFVDDMDHFRKVIKADQIDQREVRLLSLPLRRLILNNELSKIAAGRLNKRLHIKSYDLSQIYKIERQGLLTSFVASRAVIGGTPLGCILVHFFHDNLNTDYRMKRRIHKYNEDLKDLNLTPDEIDFNIDQYLKQRVSYIGGRWVTRGQCIKYLANFASVAHSNVATDENNLLVARLRNGFIIKPDKSGGIALDLDHLNETGVSPEQAKFKRKSEGIDAVSIQMLGCIADLVNSEDVLELERVVRAEIGELG